MSRGICLYSFLWRALCRKSVALIFIEVRTCSWDWNKLEHEVFGKWNNSAKIVWSARGSPYRITNKECDNPLVTPLSGDPGKTPFLVKIRLVLHSVGSKWSEASRYKSFIVFSILTIVLFVLLDINLNISLPLRALFLKYSPLSFHKFPRTNRNFDNTKFSQMTPRFTRLAKFTIILEAVSVYKFGKLAFRYIYYLNFTSIELRW